MDIIRYQLIFATKMEPFALAEARATLLRGDDREIAQWAGWRLLSRVRLPAFSQGNNLTETVLYD